MTIPSITKIVDGYDTNKIPDRGVPSEFEVNMGTSLLYQANLPSNLNILTSQINTAISAMNTDITTVNTKAVEAANSASSALTYRNETQVLRDETAAIAAAIPEGTINDSITTLTDTWSSSKINSELALKLDTTTANTQLATKLDLAQVQAVALYF